jgi:serine protease AprX
MVASIAAGAAAKRAGVDPDAPLLSIDVINDNGEGLTSDVIAAADWILQNKSTYNIRVANFSLEASTDGSFLFDPLAKAVEQLWFSGVVVVASAGNYATNGQQSGVHYMPAADPFVITVGALDIGKDGNTKNDLAAPWSAWGYTNDGFLKPEISAPGRYVIGACSTNGSLCRSGGQNPSLAAQGGYAQLSGTSFAAPMVSAAAAALLGLHPEWTPDQVKGRLMLTASPLANAVPGSVGVGELDVKGATDKINGTPPNPNLALGSFVQQTPAGPAFNADGWVTEARRVGASWSSASWSSASWSSAWSSASWSSASWSSASWSSALVVRLVVVLGGRAGAGEQRRDRLVRRRVADDHRPERSRRRCSRAPRAGSSARCTALLPRNPRRDPRGRSAARREDRRAHGPLDSVPRPLELCGAGAALRRPHDA